MDMGIHMDTTPDSGLDIMRGIVPAVRTVLGDTILGRGDRGGGHRHSRPVGPRRSRRTGHQPSLQQDHRIISTTGPKTVSVLLPRLSRPTARLPLRPREKLTTFTLIVMETCIGRQMTAGNSVRGTTGQIPVHDRRNNPLRRTDRLSRDRRIQDQARLTGITSHVNEVHSDHRLIKAGVRHPQGAEVVGGEGNSQR